MEPSEWLGPPESERLLTWHTRVVLDGAESPHEVLRMLWHALEGQLQPGFEGEEAELALLAGEPGGYFGRAEKLTGRWRSVKATPEGVWLGVRQEEHRSWPYLVRVERRGVTASKPLFDWDMFAWALLARGVCEERPEVLECQGDRLSLTSWQPLQLQRLLLLARQEQAWSWRAPPTTGASLCSLLQAYGGYEVRGGPESVRLTRGD